MHLAHSATYVNEVTYFSYIGGGILGYGCVQEEIRFVICPELIISKLFTEQMAPNESLLMIGMLYVVSSFNFSLKF